MRDRLDEDFKKFNENIEKAFPPKKYWDKDGKQISFNEWLQKNSDETYRVIRTTKIPGGRITTCWNGEDDDQTKEKIYLFKTKTPNGFTLTKTEKEACDKHNELVLLYGGKIKKNPQKNRNKKGRS